jgi:hypothetical protein
MHMTEEGTDLSAKEPLKHWKSDFIEIDALRNVRAIKNFGQSSEGQWQEL